MIWIRADGGHEIGMGHVVRCCAIASALRDMGEECCFLTADDSTDQFLKERGQAYRVLHSSFAKMEEELGMLLPILQSESNGAFLVDSYYVTADYLDRIRSIMPVCRMDDMGIVDLPSDMVINYNIYAQELLGQEALRRGQTTYLTGPEYAPLRQEFCAGSYLVRDSVKKVLITTGGSDRYNLTGQIMEAALQTPEVCSLEYCVVSGAFNKYAPQLEQLAVNYENVNIYNNVTDMARLMRECDIAVTAGGSTLYELCAVGVPSLCFSYVDNQEKAVQGFWKRNLVGYGGDYLRQGAHMVKDLVRHMGILAKDKDLRKDISKRMKALVDGQGAARIAEKIEELIHAPGLYSGV